MEVARLEHTFARVRAAVGQGCQDADSLAPPQSIVAPMAVAAASQASSAERLCRASAAVMRAALTWGKRLSPAEAAQAAFFCALALDAPGFTAAEREEARSGLSRLLERLCWQKQQWSAEDRRLLSLVHAMLRAEFP